MNIHGKDTTYENNNRNTKTRVYRRRGKGVKIEETDTCRYLRIIFNKKRNLTEHVKETESKAK